jgi:hypothetical protein
MAVDRPTAAMKKRPDARVTRGGHLLAASCKGHNRDTTGRHNSALRHLTASPDKKTTV